MTWKLHEDGWQDWMEEEADEYAAAQRKAFLAGFEAAAAESQEFRLLREWLAKERDKAKAQYDETENDLYHAKREAYIDVLVKLSEVGVRSGPDE